MQSLRDNKKTIYKYNKNIIKKGNPKKPCPNT